MNKFLLKISCSDELGLINTISNILLKYKYNIIENNEYVDKSNNIFLMRTLVEGEGESPLQELNKEIKNIKSISWKRFHKPNIVIMCSDEYHCIGDILMKNSFNDFNANILGVISQKNNLKNLVELHKVPFYLASCNNCTREEQEHKVSQILKALNPDFIITAKYMRIFSKNFVKDYKEKIINIHHSFLPSFKGFNPYKEAHERGVKMIGATAHFINENLDDGPIISQGILPIQEGWSVNDFKKEGQKIEVDTLNRAMDIVFKEKFIVMNKKTFIF